jgi:hypothetical protein
MDRGVTRRAVLGAGLVGGAALVSGCRLFGGEGEPLVEEILKLHGRDADAVYGVDNSEPASAAGGGDRDFVPPKPWREDPPDRPGSLYRQQVAAASLVGRAVACRAAAWARRPSRRSWTRRASAARWRTSSGCAASRARSATTPRWSRSSRSSSA